MLNRYRVQAASLALLATCLLGVAAALKTAAMVLPQDFAESALRLPARGYGGANRGTYTLGEYGGEFVRIESRFAVFDPLYVSNRGKSSFTIGGPGIVGTIRGECSFRQKVVAVGVVTFNAKKLAYVCDVVDGEGRAAGTLTLGEPRPDSFKARLLAHERRAGESTFGDIRIGIASAHELVDAQFRAPTPVGYMLTHESLAVGAIELTDTNPTIFLAAGQPTEIRIASLVAALGLSVLRDPADSMLGE